MRINSYLIAGIFGLLLSIFAYLVTESDPIDGSRSRTDWRAVMPRDIQAIATKHNGGGYVYPLEMARLSAFIEAEQSAWNDFCAFRRGK